jgi:hypothetical protein
VIEQDENLPDDKTYRATFELPGAACKVSETEFDFSYTCSWPQADTADWPGTVRQARTLVNALAECSQLKAVDFGESRDGDAIRWRGIVSYNYASRMKVEVTASNFAGVSRRQPKRLAAIYLAVRYRRETRP